MGKTNFSIDDITRKLNDLKVLFESDFKSSKINAMIQVEKTNHEDSVAKITIQLGNISDENHSLCFYVYNENLVTKEARMECVKNVKNHMIRKYLPSILVSEIDLRKLLSEEYLKNHVKLEFVNKEIERELLAEVPSISILDLALIAKIEIEPPTGFEDLYITTVVTYKMLQSADEINIQFKDIVDLGIQYIYKNDCFQIKTPMDVLLKENEMGTNEILDTIKYSIFSLTDTLNLPNEIVSNMINLEQEKVLMEIEKQKEDSPFFIICAKNNINDIPGSSILAFPELLDRLVTKFGIYSDFFLLPNQNNCILIKDGPDAKKIVTHDILKMKEMSIPEEDYLTDSIYFFHRDCKQLERCGSYENIQELEHFFDKRRAV